MQPLPQLHPTGPDGENQQLTDRPRKLDRSGGNPVFMLLSKHIEGFGPLRGNGSDDGRPRKCGGQATKAC